MNLKESFRYQKFLDSLLHNAVSALQSESLCLKVTNTHLRSQADPDASDIVEVIESDSVYTADDIISFMMWLVNEREKLTYAISKAKNSISFDLDTAVETNKFRQTISRSINYALSFSPYKRTEEGRGYKFNAEGNQMPYLYNVEVTSEEAYDRKNAKAVMREMIMSADKVSSEIDIAMITTAVDYEPVFDVNDTFNDVITEFIAKGL